MVFTEEHGEIFHGYSLTEGQSSCWRYLILLMAEILHQLIGRFFPLVLGFHTSQVVQDFSHQQYHPGKNGSSEIIFSFLAFGLWAYFQGLLLAVRFWWVWQYPIFMNFHDAISWSVEIVFENVWWWKLHKIDNDHWITPSFLTSIRTNETILVGSSLIPRLFQHLWNTPLNLYQQAIKGFLS